MVHNAYDLYNLIENCSSKIEAIAYYGPKLLVGCGDGSLMVYAPESSASDISSPSGYQLNLGIRKETYVLQRTVSGFSKKALVSMEVSGSREFLLSLSETIAFHRLPNLESISVITKAKGANVFAWDDHRGFLCFARQKRVCIFRHDGGWKFVEVKDFGVPDLVKAIAWCGENICLGIGREYTILNATTGALCVVFPPGRIVPPLVVPLPSGELLLGKDNIGVFVDQNGKLIQGGRICWSDAPLVVVIHKPYAVALLPRHIEIRSLNAPYPLVQTVVLRNVYRLICSNGSVIIALHNSIYGLFPVPIGAQIIQLTASANFEEALALCKLLPPEDSSLRASKVASIHIRYGHYLFDNGSYEEAIEHFYASQVDITYVLCLYPSIVLPKPVAVSELQNETDFAWDTPHLSRVSSDASDDIEILARPKQLESDEYAILESKKLSHNSLIALVKFLRKKRDAVIDNANDEGTDEVVSSAVENCALDPNSSEGSNKDHHDIHISSVAREMAATLDTALVQALLLTGQSSAAIELLKAPNYCDIKICEEFLRTSNCYTALLELYKCNGMHREALILLNELVKESKSEQPQCEPTQEFRPEMIIEYLKPLCETDPMLVLEFSMLVLESCPTRTIELLLSEYLPADLVNSYLKQHVPSMQATYLERMFGMNENGIPGNLQNEMVQIYLSEVLDWYADQTAQQKWDEQLYSPTRKKLLSALESVSGYNPEGLLKRLPMNALYEERAILLGKLNQHQLALSIYVHKLHVPELALAYCDHVYEARQHQLSSKSQSNIYLTLLQIYRNPRTTNKAFEKQVKNWAHRHIGIQKVGSIKTKGSRMGKKIAEIEGADDTKISLSNIGSGESNGGGDEPSEEGHPTIMLDKVLDLLSQRWDRMDGAQALKLLPGETNLQKLFPFLEQLLKKSSEAYRNFSVIKSLRQSENLQVKGEFYQQRGVTVKISKDSMCSLCNKKIGTSVFAVYPNSKTLVHFVCFRDTQHMKAVVKGSSLKKWR
ncbi:hypothetical protein NE237_022463 [Protea cynaroides]|uniref:CNH domain-containing protein n=1 Tax=Protea cynaroides TaxID=273540 RepID=A0A9Q0K3J7_9MAGN|nr:hypothetical protein NE237_022463 [Protea cynaroides]